MQKASIALSFALTFALKCAHGQDLHALQTCTQLADDAARLSCYDAALGVAKPASATQSPLKHSDGGLRSEGKITGPKRVSAQVRDVALLPTGLYRLTLDNGQIWETTQADSALAFRVNDSIVISRGLLGSNQVALAGHTTSVGVIRKQ